jgi:hypothetical protein
MAGRKKHLSDDAEKLQVSLTPEEQLVLQVIKVRRKKRLPGRSGQSQIVADGLWKLLLEEENVPREYITRLSDLGDSGSGTTNNVREIRTKDGA